MLSPESFSVGRVLEYVITRFGVFLGLYFVEEKIPSWLNTENSRQPILGLPFSEGKQHISVFTYISFCSTCSFPPPRSLLGTIPSYEGIEHLFPLTVIIEYCISTPEAR